MSVVEFVPFLQLISAVVPWTHHVGPFYHLRGILLHPWKQGSNPRKQLLRQTSPSSVTAELPFSSREAGGSAGGWTRNQAGSMGPPWILGIPGKARAALCEPAGTHARTCCGSRSRCFPGNGCHDSPCSDCPQGPASGRKCQVVLLERF